MTRAFSANDIIGRFRLEPLDAKADTSVAPGFGRSLITTRRKLHALCTSLRQSHSPHCID